MNINQNIRLWNADKIIKQRGGEKREGGGEYNYMTENKEPVILTFKIIQIAEPTI